MGHFPVDAGLVGSAAERYGVSGLCEQIIRRVGVCGMVGLLQSWRGLGTLRAGR